MLLDPFSDLVISAQLVLDAEFTDAASARQVLTAIGAAQTAITRALRILKGPKDLIRIEVPSGAASKSRLRRYRLTDPYLQFWFRFIARHLEDISRSRGDIAVAAFDAGWTSWRGRAIEPHVNEALTRLGAAHPELAGAQQAGPWWNRDNSLEVDIVARSDRAYGLLLHDEPGRDWTTEKVDVLTRRAGPRCDSGRGEPAGGRPSG